ncbi:aspartate/ornithine carbamoyltransferase family protein [Aggregatilinea lenta]|uniref:aspartate/ornithine carbamoyltransferase family protein n=1 Tax=Aggregatilinea lenta TaxID=913108 RepID=UPI000E5B0A0E|nr:aspartate carbamoyltransferase [Aggregatilinea lenta]
MANENAIKTVRSLVRNIDYEGKSLLSINDLTNDQIYGLFELARALEPWNRSAVPLLTGNVMAALFFQPSTRTRMSFETAMHRLGGAVITEATPMVSSSIAKEESLADMIKVVSKYANVIVLRHPNDVDARDAVTYSDAPVISGGFGHWEHPTQALLDMYTLWRTHNKVEGVKVCIASADLVAARTGHSMAYGLARLGADVTLACPKSNRTPPEVMDKLAAVGGNVKEEFDLTQDGFNELIAGMDLVYLPGCSAPKGAEADAFKKIMDDYYVRFETLDKVRQEEGRIVHVTHTLPRRAGEMDLRIDTTPNQQYFEAIAYSVSIRMALVASILGV